jgi:hypothetical protein
MPEQITRAIQFKSQKEKHISDAQMFVQTYNDKEQKIRAIKTLLLFWLIAAVCVLIPIAHFLLVPGFFIVGIMKAIKLWNKAEDGLNAQGECPVCHKQITFNLEKSTELPLWRDCPECGESLELNLAS